MHHTSGSNIRGGHLDKEQPQVNISLSRGDGERSTGTGSWHDVEMMKGIGEQTPQRKPREGRRRGFQA